MVNITSERAVGSTHHATYRTGLLALIVGIAIATAASQAHHSYDPGSGSGWREWPYYTISGLIGYAIAFGLGLLRVRRTGTTKSMVSTALVLGVVGVVLFPVAWYTPIPFVFGVGAVLLALDAKALAGRQRLNLVGLALGSLAIVGTVVLFGYRIIEAVTH